LAPTRNLASLDSALAGDALVPGDDGWDAARQAWNLLADQRPEAVVLAAGPEDVAATVRFARDNGLRVAAQATGHAALGIESLEDTILLKTSRMRSVEVDPTARRARVQAGAIWGDVASAAAEHGLAGLGGSAHDVGVVGYTLGGGHGWLARKHGLASNWVLSAELVTADGELVRADRDENPDLFWALRGGGGSFGVVTALEFELHPLPEVYGGMLAWPADRAHEVVHAYREWAAGLPAEMSAWVRFLHLPPLPDVPEPLRDRPVVDVTSVYAGPAGEGEELMRPLTELRDPIIDGRGPIGPAALGRLNGDPPEPVPGLGAGAVITEFPSDAADALIDVAGPASGNPLLTIQLRPLGGALAQAPENAGVTGAVAGEFMYYAVGMPMPQGGLEPVIAHLQKVSGTLGPWLSERSFLNFVDTPGSASSSFDGEAFSRLQQIRAERDPDGIFRASNEIAAV
jgi:FAD/FMN-containing dehydrogenase